MKQFALNSKLYLPTRVAIFVPASCTQDLVKNDTRLPAAPERN